MKSEILEVKKITIKKERIDSLGSYYRSLNMWLCSPLWLHKELLSESLRGTLWIHKKKSTLVVAQIKVEDQIIVFITTQKRFDWLTNIGFFKSGPFLNKALELNNKSYAG